MTDSIRTAALNRAIELMDKLVDTPTQNKKKIQQMADMMIAKYEEGNAIVIAQLDKLAV